MLQQPIPVQVLLRDTSGAGTAYVRFALGAGGFTGVAASLADGLDAADVSALLAGGTPLEDAAVLHAGARRIELQVPGLVSASATEVQLFLVYEGDPILSNPATPEGALP
jgi:hypothetical protein